MEVRRKWVLLVGVLFSLGADFRTANFRVTAPTAKLAREFAEVAEQQRKALALSWLGKELADWAEPCRIEVTVSLSAGGGATTFAFEQRKVLSQSMTLEGKPERIREAILPHEVAHTILAHHFRQPVPRWFDEGAATLAEGPGERLRQERALAKSLRDKPDRLMPLGRLLGQRDYPSDVQLFYWQSTALVGFLLDRGDRRKLLAFVEHGMRDGWDAAVKAHYDFRDLDALERDWLRRVHAALDRVD